MNELGCRFCTVEIDSKGNATHEVGCAQAEIARLQERVEEEHGRYVEAVIKLEHDRDRYKERVEEAERELAEHGCHKVESAAFRDRDHYKAQAERRKGALDFYADEGNWAVNEDSCQCGEPSRNCCCPAPANDDGIHARAAIEGVLE